MSCLGDVMIAGVLLVWQLGCSSSVPPSSPALRAASANISISPSVAVAGSPDLTVTVTGSQQFLFTDAAHQFNQVTWSANGSDTVLMGTFVSSSKLTVTVPATLLGSAVHAQVRVEIWDMQGDGPIATSNSVPFSVTAPTPSIKSISPMIVSAGTSDLTLTITGANFENYESVAFWTTDPHNLHDYGTMLNTTFVGDTQLTAIIPAALLQNPGSVQIVVLTGDPMGMSDGFFGYPESNSLTFTVNP